MDATRFDPNAAAAPDSGIFGLRAPPAECRVHLIPVPVEATTSYGAGASKGPAAILDASRQVDLYDADFGRAYEDGIALLDAPPGIAALDAAAKAAALGVIERGGAVGNDRRLLAAVAKVDRAGERVNALCEAAAEAALADGRIVGVVGGDHSAPFGAIRAIARRSPGLGILHIDAHADLRDAYEGFAWSHASIMFNVQKRVPEVARIVQVGIRDFCEQEADVVAASKGRIKTHFDAALAEAAFEGRPFARTARAIVRDLPREVYVSFDIDGLDPALCPNTGTPVPGGLSFREAVHLVREVVRSGRRIVGFDLCEVVPGPDGGAWDANVGARVLYKLAGFALLSHRAKAPRRKPSRR